MLLWEDIARAQKTARNENETPFITCPKCEGTYFTLEEYKQYRNNATVGLSQKPPPSPRGKTFYFYRCLCGELLEPNISTNFSSLSDEYIQTVENLRKVLDAKNNK